MPAERPTEATRVLRAIETGDAKATADLLPIVYATSSRTGCAGAPERARRCRPTHSSTRPTSASWGTTIPAGTGRDTSSRRPRSRDRAPHEDVLALHEALDRLEAEAPRAARTVRYFAGLTSEETALAMGLSLSTVERDWPFARALLRSWLEDGPP